LKEHNVTLIDIDALKVSLSGIFEKLKFTYEEAVKKERE